MALLVYRSTGRVKAASKTARRFAGDVANAATEHLAAVQVVQAFTLEDSRGSRVLFGDMQLVPVGKGLLYVRPIYVKAEGQTAIPDLRYVVVIGNGKLGRGDSLSAALNALFPGAQVILGDRSGTASPGTSTGGDTGTGDGGATTTTVPGGSGAPETLESLLAEASQLFDEADAALRAGDLATYQAKIKAARDKVAQAEQLLTGSTPTTTTVPTPKFLWRTRWPSAMPPDDWSSSS